MEVAHIESHHPDRVSCLVDEAFCHRTGNVVVFLQYSHDPVPCLLCDVGVVVEYARDGGDRDSRFFCYIIDVHIVSRTALALYRCMSAPLILTTIFFIAEICPFLQPGRWISPGKKTTKSP